ncbi:hypothetical protein [Phycicoccus sp. DTK01]|uniref:hypothetical protein n=1 Tax=Phycicoccus sp. DTK01 TaxID=2785745 RepID=UPI001A90B5F3|nr:hypothetical protein [Phycicoccus sp. DTK01]GIL35650.1 hypothetical protein PDTK01_17250 [Phycicoccus sp. DTK01]
MATGGRAVRGAAAGTAALVLVVGSSGCSSDEPFAGSDIRPTASPSATVTPVPSRPVGSREVTGRGWTMAVPGQWEERRRTVSSGEVARWSEPASAGSTRVAVSVVVETEPTTSLLEQSYRLEQRLRENDLRPQRSTVPGADPARPGVLVQWTENSRGDEQRREVWQLFLAGPGTSIVNVVGFAPEDGFGASRVPEVMGTVEVQR